MTVNGMHEQIVEKMLTLRPICADMERDDVCALLQKGELVKFAPSQIISFSGQASSGVFIIIEGSVLIQRFPRWGDHAIYVARRESGTIVGEVSGGRLGQTLYSNAHPGKTVTETNCVMLKITHDEFRKMIIAGGLFAWNVLNCSVDKVRESADRLEVSKHRSAVSRVAGELLDLAEQQGRTEGIEIPMRMNEFAWWLDLEPPTLSRTLSQMNGEGSIRYITRRHKNDPDNPSVKEKPGTVSILDKEKLFFLCNSDGSKYQRT